MIQRIIATADAEAAPCEDLTLGPLCKDDGGGGGAGGAQVRRCRLNTSG